MAGIALYFTLHEVFIYSTACHARVKNTVHFMLYVVYYVFHIGNSILYTACFAVDALSLHMTVYTRFVTLRCIIVDHQLFIIVDNHLFQCIAVC